MDSMNSDCPKGKGVVDLTVLLALTGRDCSNSLFKEENGEALFQKWILRSKVDTRYFVVASACSLSLIISSKHRVYNRIKADWPFTSKRIALKLTYDSRLGALTRTFLVCYLLSSILYCFEAKEGGGD